MTSRGERISLARGVHQVLRPHDAPAVATSLSVPQSNREDCPGTAITRRSLLAGTMLATAPTALPNSPPANAPAARRQPASPHPHRIRRFPLTPVPRPLPSGPIAD